MPTGASQGGAIGYASVTETFSDGSRINRQYYEGDLKLYGYSRANSSAPWKLVNVARTHTDAPLECEGTEADGTLPKNYPAAPLPYDYYRGKMKSETQYDVAGNQVLSKDYTYTFADEAVMDYTPGIILSTTPVDFVPKLSGETFYNLTHKKRESDVVVTTQYENGIAQTTRETNQYSQLLSNQLRSAELVTAEGEIITTQYRYPEDLLVTTSPSTSFYDNYLVENATLIDARMKIPYLELVNIISSYSWQLPKSNCYPILSSHYFRR